MQAKKTLKSGERAALLTASAGGCYNPACPEPLVVVRDGNHLVNFEIAHIRDELAPSSPDADVGWRYWPDDLTQDERNRFENLILLCGPCHKLIDKTHPRRFGVELLQAWKHAAEGRSTVPLAAALSGLQPHQITRFLMSDLIGVAPPEGGDGPGDLRLPHVAGLPDPYDRRPLVGRLDEMVRLRPAGRFQVTAVLGSGGLGKTALVAGFCRGLRQEPEPADELGATNLIRWFSAVDRAPLLDSYVRFGEALGCAVPGMDRADAVAQTRRWFESTSLRWTIVFDNVERPADLDDLLPKGGNGHVIVTSRASIWPDAFGGSVFELGPLLDADAHILLAERCPRLGHEEVLRLCERLGNLALALVQAAAYLDITGMSCDAYIAALDEGTDAARRLLSANTAEVHEPVTDQGVTLASVWDASMKRVVAQWPGADEAMRVAAYTHHRDIPMGVFGCTEPGAVPGSTASVPEEVRAAIGPLVRFRLLDAGRSSGDDMNDTVHVHPVVQDVVRAWDRDRVGLALAPGALVRASGPPSWDDPRDQATYGRRFGPHVHSVLMHERRLPGGLTRSEARDLVDLHGQALVLGRQGGAGVAFFTDLVDDWRTWEPAEVVERLVAEDLLGRANYWNGAFDDALTIQERVADELVEHLGPDAPEALTAQANLALTLWAVGRVAESIALGQVVIEGRTRVLGDLAPDTLSSRNDLALALWSAGDFTGAIAEGTDVLRIRADTLPPDHPDTLISKHNLGLFLFSGGKDDKALALQQHTYEERVRLLGPRHPDSLRSAASWAYSLAFTGKTAKAIAVAGPVAHERERLLGPDHPDTLTSQHNLARYLLDDGRVGEARALAVSVLERRRALLPGQPNTLKTQSVVAQCDIVLGAAQEAAASLEEVTRLQADLHGPDHPDTLTTMHHLARALWEEGSDRDRAISLAAEVLRLRRGRLDSGHPDIEASRLQLAGWTGDSGRSA